MGDNLPWPTMVPLRGMRQGNAAAAHGVVASDLLTSISVSLAPALTGLWTSRAAWPPQLSPRGSLCYTPAPRARTRPVHPPYATGGFLECLASPMHHAALSPFSSLCS